ncbi:putative leader peptide [Streptomyces sp. NPDC090306]|uniref:putative leader peptide n=1 Tax=Streptomyces sp. NPDC090306 TaxID=3365961 RepID=UPI00382EF03B
MGRPEAVTGRGRRAPRGPLPLVPPAAVPAPASPLLTSRRHIDLLRVCSAIGRVG